jgi:hypothetical protein
MTSNYPGSKDNLTTVLGGDAPLNNPSHSETHNETNEAVNAIQNYVGVSGDTTEGTLTGNLYVTKEAVEENTTSIEANAEGIKEINTLIFGGVEGNEDPLFVTGGHNTPGLQLWLGTKAEYDALAGVPGYSPSTLYVVT